MSLKNKVVVITGAASGIGYQITEEYLKQDAKVAVILDFNEKDGKNAALYLNSKYGDGRAVFYKCDVTKDLKEISKTIKENFNAVDILVNNAGMLDESQVRKTIDINVVALIEWTLEFMNLMRKDKGGHGGTIINVASICGFRPFPFMPTYQASKFAVLGFTKCIGHQYNYNRTGVRIMAICPGFTKTTLGTGIMSFENDADFIAESKKVIAEQVWQDVGVLGKAAVDVYVKGTPGSAWLIEGGKAITEV